MASKLEKLTSAIYNNVNSGLQGFRTNDSLSLELIEDYIILERLQILKEYSLKGILPLLDLYTSINCIDVDCMDIERCGEGGTPMPHFEIPMLLNDYGDHAIEYLGSADRSTPFTFYTSNSSTKYHQHRKRGQNKPYVWIDTTPNKNGKCDCFVYNAPFLKKVAITAIFKDPRQLDGYSCGDDTNFSFIDNEIIKRLTQKLIMWYRQYAQHPGPNNQIYDQG